MRMRSIQLQRNQFIETKDVQSTSTTQSISKIQPGAVDFSPQWVDFGSGWWKRPALMAPLLSPKTIVTRTKCYKSNIVALSQPNSGGCCKKVQVSLRPSVLCQPRQLARVPRVKCGTSVPVDSCTRMPADRSISVQKYRCTKSACGVNRWHDLDRKNWSTRMQHKLPQLEQRCWFG